jgi:hypothetical protein
VFELGKHDLKVLQLLCCSNNACQQATPPPLLPFCQTASLPQRLCYSQDRSAANTLLQASCAGRRSAALGHDLSGGGACLWAGEAQQKWSAQGW